MERQTDLPGDSYLEPLEISDEDAESITNVQLAIDYLSEHGIDD